MKKMITSAALFLSVWVQAQIVNIPDPAFKAKLLEASPSNNIAYFNGNAVKIDTNNDGEIQNIEAEAIDYLNVSNSGIGSLVGIEAFTSIRTLAMSQNNISHLDVGSLNYLENLDCSHNLLTDITNIEMMIFLRSLDCDFNQLTSLNLSQAFDFGYIDASHNHLQEIIFSQSVHEIQYIYLSYNQLTYIDFSQVEFFKYLFLDHNQLTNVDFSVNGIFLSNWPILDFSYNPLTHLDITNMLITREEGDLNPIYGEELNIHHTLLTELTLSNAEFGNLDISNNPNLNLLSVKNSRNYNWAQGINDYYSNLPQLHYVCIDESISSSYIRAMFANNPNIVFGSYCTFTPGGSYQTITGNIRYDLNLNGCTSTDVAARQLPIKMEQSAQSHMLAFTNNNGDYTGFVPSGNVTLTPQLENSYYTLSPSSYTTTFTTANQTQTANFCLTPNGNHNDLEIALLPITPARPGFNAQYKIIYSNPGTTVQSGTVSFYYSEDRLDFVSANPSVSTSGSGILTWAYTNLNPLEHREIVVTLNVNSPVETPAVTVGDILTFIASVSPSANDETYWNNNNLLEQVVVGSFDPNDKTASILNHPYELADTTDILYTIRFQNMGTAAAENVVISDVFSGKLNDDSFRMISSSHPCELRYKKSTRKLECIFEGIQLPAAITDEPGSHGYVTFKIKANNSGIVADDVLENKADIYFDYNVPVPTNTTQTTFYSILANDHFTVGQNYTMHPNPAQDQITFSGSFSKAEVEIYNLAGARLLQTSLQPQQALPLALPAGMYLVKWQVDGQNLVQKLIIK